MQTQQLDTSTPFMSIFSSTSSDTGAYTWYTVFSAWAHLVLHNLLMHHSISKERKIFLAGASMSRKNSGNVYVHNFLDNSITRWSRPIALELFSNVPFKVSCSV